ncbi:TPA: LPXTG cell wall anchor domain-containing protein [Streptococcus suis]|nr:LPXTG cell wall anchor domain-containing protein [Streptococcus suis]HEM6419137.1 LPXTG cell wall anchor domain-containing protein [Streptococcus suis]HEM6425977.1 LPXTG cell wall anchor domain-containing protein [Streptococcus suis]
MSTKKTYLLRKTSIGLVSLATLAIMGTTVSANEIGVASAHGTGATADPTPALNLNNGELTAKGSSVLNSDYKPALDPSTVEITKHGEGVVAEVPEVKLGFDNGEPYVYAHGEGVTAAAELPALDPSTVDITKHGEGVTAPVLDEVAIALDENGLYLKNVPTAAPTAEALPTVQIGGTDGDYYLYTKGTGVTTELPTSEGLVETAKGEGVTTTLPEGELPAMKTAKGEGAKIDELLAVSIGKDELGEYLFSKGTSVTAVALPTIDPATVKATETKLAEKTVTETKTAEKKATSTASEKLPETGEVMTVLSLVGGLGLLGSAALLKKRK